jgi:hypothetical protein
MSHPSNPNQAEPGKGAAGDQWAVQTAQTTDVNDPEAKIPSDGNPDYNKEQLRVAAQSEGEADFHTTDGFVIDESGKMDNFAIEPEMYVEEK